MNSVIIHLCKLNMGLGRYKIICVCVCVIDPWYWSILFIKHKYVVWSIKLFMHNMVWYGHLSLLLSNQTRGHFVHAHKTKTASGRTQQWIRSIFFLFAKRCHISCANSANWMWQVLLCDIGKANKGHCYEW